MKTKPVVTRYKADEDVDIAFEHYLANAGPEIAIRFMDEYERSISHLSRNPLIGSPLAGHRLGIDELRQWPLRHFPYLIFYFDFEHVVEIWRVLHSRIDIPAWLQDDE